MLVLRLLLAILRVHINDLLDLVLSLLLRQYELIDQPIFAHHDALLVNDIVEFAVVLLQNIVLVILVLLVILQILVAPIAITPIITLHVILSLVLVIACAVFPLENVGLALALLFTVLVVELLENVLDLPLELIVDLVHQVLQHFGHSELFGLLAELFASEDGVERSVDVGSHLWILVFDKLVQYFQEFNLGVFTFILPTGPE